MNVIRLDQRKISEALDRFCFRDERHKKSHVRIYAWAFHDFPTNEIASALSSFSGPAPPYPCEIHEILTTSRKERP